jgi:S-DNA-T family DNA segregation ATPase FtsK/SpoIIIE
MARGMRDSRWVDPAPFEVARPRLPWWTLLPGWVKVVVLPFALLWVMLWLLVRLGRLAWRYPLTLALVLVVLAMWRRLGVWWLVGVAGGLVLVGVVWWWRHRSSFTVSVGRFVVPQARSEWRRAWIYAVQWRSVMRLSGLTKDLRQREYRPKLGRVRSDGWRDRVRVRMVKGQAPETWELHASGLAHAFGATSCRVRVHKPGRLDLDFLHRDPLVRPLSVPALAAEGSAVDLRKVVVGRSETGRPWTLRLLGTQVLVAGASGAGKGSVLWSLLWALAPTVKAGLVRLVGIDPKGGMELGQAPDVFDRVVFDNGEAAVTLLEELAAQVKARAAAYRGRLRSWHPGTGDPFIVLVVDELADVIAYQADRKLRERAERAVQAITSQGRAPGVCVVGLLQDPRKEIISFRHLFSTRVAMRLDEPTQVDMVLGDGVRQRGANAHEISEYTPGVAWIKEDGRREPVRARAFHVTDADLDTLTEYVTGRPVHRADVIDFRGGAAA